MKKHSLYSPFLRLSLVSLFVLPFPSCVQYEELQAWDSIGPEKKSDVDPDVPAEDNPIVTFSVGLNPDEETEIGIEVQDGSLHTKWMEGDQIRVVSFDAAGSIVTNGEKLFTIQAGFTDHEAAFSGEKVEGSSYAILHPSVLSYSQMMDKPFNGLTQTENNSVSHLQYSATMTGLTSHPSDLPGSKVAFSEDFVYALRGSMPKLNLKKSSYVHNRLGLPAATKNVQRVEMEALEVGGVPGSDRIFHTSNREQSLTSVLVLYLEDVAPAVNDKGNKVLDTYMAIPWWGYTMQPSQRIQFSVYYTDTNDEKKVVTKTMTNAEGLVTKAYNGLCVHNNINLINVSPSSSIEEGTAENPYLLSTASDLMAIKSRLKDGEEVYFRMENDIDLAGIDWVPISNTSPYNRTIHFDGNGKIIYNLRCVGQDYSSFFGVLVGECHDLGFVNAYIEGNGTFAGIVAGYMGTAGVIDGIGALNRCFTDGIVQNQTGGGVGGLVGATGYSRTGSDNAEINDCYSSALVRNINNSCGGLVGAARVNEDHGGLHINRSYFSGAIDSHYGNIGGLLGNVNENVASRMFISDCAVLAKVMYNDRTSVSGTYQNIAGGTQSLLTISSTTIWDGILGCARYDGVGSDDLSSIQSQFSAFSNWSSTTGLNGEPLLNWVVARDDYDDAPPASCGGDNPALWEGATTNAGIRSYYFDSGTGEADDEPHLITRAFQLYQMAPKMDALYAAAGGSASTSYFKLGADIDMAPIASWVPLNTANYDKKYIDFDGNGKTIDHLNCNAGTYRSFFGILNGNVRNVTFDHATIAGNNSNGCSVVAAYLGSGGGCASFADRIVVSNSTVSGGSGYRGALAGSVNHAGSTVTNSYVSDCTISGTGTYVGGMIGNIQSDATLSGRNIVSGTSVSGNGHTGGLFGGVPNVAVTVNVSGCTYTGGTVTSTGQYTGGLVGVAYASSTTRFSDCQVENATINVTGCVSPDKVTAGGFIGYLSVNSEVKGCRVGTSGQHVSIRCAQPGGTSETASSKRLRVGGFVGEHLGTITRNGSVHTKAYVTINCTNTLTTQEICLGGFCGYPSEAVIEYSDVEATMTGLIGCNIGGFCGNIDGASTIDHCTISANVSGSSRVGGLVGWINGGSACTISNCTVSGSVTATGGQVGGLAGVQNSTSATITDFSSSINVISRGQNSGGLAGQIAGGTITRCAVSGNVTCTNVSSGTNSLAGGFFGRVTIESGNSLTMSSCAFTGSITASGREVGGLVGAIYHGNGDAGSLSVSDCLVSGNVTAAGQWAGGILGTHNKGAVTLTNCLVTGSVTGLCGVGAIYGASTTSTNDLSLSMTRCMAYNSSLRGTATDGDENSYARYSCGGVLGYYRGAVVVNHCYRKPDLDFLDCQPSASGNVLEDNDFINPAAAIPQRHSNSGGTGYCYSHHGKENPKASLTALVTSGEIGGDWDPTIWDLSGDIPSLWFMGNLEGYSNPVTLDWGE